MNQYKIKSRRTKIIAFISMFFISAGMAAQPGYGQPWVFQNVPFMISFGVHFDPVISWFQTHSYDIRNESAVPGYNFGISYNRYYYSNVSFSSGVNIIEAGGRLLSTQPTIFELKNYTRETVTVEPGEAIIYHIKYFSVPLGIKLQTNETGFGRLFMDVGFDPKIVISGRADIPSLNIKDDNAMLELRPFNLSYHIMAGMEYPLGAGAKAVFGMGFENNLLDTTRENRNDPWDFVSHKLLSFRLGINF
jgi:hypothetical protein